MTEEPGRGIRPRPRVRRGPAAGRRSGRRGAEERGWGAAGWETPRGGGLAIPLNPPYTPQLPGSPPSCHVRLPGGKREKARPGPMPLPS